MPPRLRSPVPVRHHVREWRKQRKMTLQQVADAIGGSKGFLSNMENGVYALTPATAEAIAAVFGIDAETLRCRTPGEENDLEREMMTLFRGGTILERKAMIEAGHAIRLKGQR